jgi:hypothetical protein
MKSLFTFLVLLMFSFTTTALATPSFGGVPKKTKTAFGTSTGNAFKQQNKKKASKKSVQSPNSIGATGGKSLLCESKFPGQEEAIFFDGTCKTMSWFESHVGSADATVMMVTGTQQATNNEGISVVELTYDGVLRTHHLSTTPYPMPMGDSSDPSGEHLGYFYDYMGEVAVSAAPGGEPIVSAESYTLKPKMGWEIDFSELTIFSSSHWMICDENGCVDAMALNGDECAMLGAKASNDFLNQCLDSFKVSSSNGFISLMKKGSFGLFHRGGAVGCGILAMNVGTSTESECNAVYSGDAISSTLNIAEEMIDEPEFDEDEKDLDKICSELTETKLGFMVETINGVLMNCDRVESTHCEPSMDDETCECETYFGPWECVGIEFIEE